MNLLGVQIISILFALFMFYLAFLSWKRQEINFANFFMWTCIWASFIFISFFHHLLEPIISVVKIIRVMDFLMIIAFMILTYLGFKNYTSNNRMEKRLEEFSRKLAISNYYKNEEKKARQRAKKK